MTLPAQKDVRDPLLALLFLRGGRLHSLLASETYGPLAAHFGLSDRDLAEERYFSDDRREARWNNVVQWAPDRLCRAGLIARPGPGHRGRWTLTSAGVERARALALDYSGFSVGVCEADDPIEPPGRVLVTAYRVLRDSALSRVVKAIHRYECQVCGRAIELPGDRLYAEAHHIRPLGSPHDGPDCASNILCLCPNHHVELDYGAVRLRLDLK